MTGSSRGNRRRGRSYVSDQRRYPSARPYSVPPAGPARSAAWSMRSRSPRISSTRARRAEESPSEARRRSARPSMPSSISPRFGPGAIGILLSRFGWGAPPRGLSSHTWTWTRSPREWDWMGPVRGTVTKILGASSTVDCGPAGVFQCGLRSRLSRKGGVRLAVGDRVMVTPSDVGSGETALGAPAPGMIGEVDPRRTVLRRGHDRERGHIVCANVDRIFIVVAVSDPPYNRSFIDRLIVGVERDALAPVVVVNK